MYSRSKTTLEAWRAVAPLAMVLLIGAATLPAMAQTTTQDQASATTSDNQSEAPALLSEEELASDIRTFNPGDTWEVVE